MKNSQAHCAGCHRHFSSSRPFDDHFDREGNHRDPYDKNKTYVQDEDGMWKGVMSDEAKFALGIHSPLGGSGF